MRRAGWLLVACFCAGLLLGIGPVAAKKKPKKTFLYVQDSNRVHGFAVAADGSLTPIPGSPFATGDGAPGCSSHCQTMAYLQKKKLLFVAGDSGVTVFQVAADGSLAAVAGSPFGGADVIGVEAVKRGKKHFVYATAYNDDELHGFSVGKSGALTSLAGFPITTGLGPVGMAAAGNRLFVTYYNQDSAGVFDIGTKGQLTEHPDSPVNTSAEPFNVAARSDGGLFYVPQAGGTNSRGFRVTMPAIQEVAGSPFSLGLPSLGGLVFDSGTLGFGWSGPTLQGVRILGNGNLSLLGGQQAAGAAVESAALEGSGRLLAVGSGDGDVVRLFTVDPNNGALTETDSEPIDSSAGDVLDVQFALR